MGKAVASLSTVLDSNAEWITVNAQQKKTYHSKLPSPLPMRLISIQARIYLPLQCFITPHMRHTSILPSNQFRHLCRWELPLLPSIAKSEEEDWVYVESVYYVINCPIVYHADVVIFRFRLGVQQASKSGSQSRLRANGTKSLSSWDLLQLRQQFECADTLLCKEAIPQQGNRVDKTNVVWSKGWRNKLRLGWCAACEANPNIALKHKVMAECRKYNNATWVWALQGIPALVWGLNSATVNTDILALSGQTSLLDVSELILVNLIWCVSAVSTIKIGKNAHLLCRCWPDISLHSPLPERRL
jgi:hypothetical protein